METARARKAQEQRREARAGTFLEKGRPTLATTRDRREKLQGLFEAWLRARGRTWNGLLALAKHDVEQLNEVLIWYGQWLYEEGRPYYHLSETINAFSLPALRYAASFKQHGTLLLPGSGRSPRLTARRYPGKFC